MLTLSGSISGTGWNVLFASLIVLVGFGWGFSFTLFPTITSEVYGSENFGICYSYVNLGSLLGSIVVPNLDALASQKSVCICNNSFFKLIIDLFFSMDLKFCSYFLLVFR